MEIFIREMLSEANQVWMIDSDRAIRLDVTNAAGGPGTAFRAGAGKDIWAVMADQTPWFIDGNPFRPLKVGAGSYYPRIARPDVRGGETRYSPGLDPALLATSRGQVETLSEQLKRICRTVHPEAANLATFGHDVRNLLILAATEVEMHLRGVLTANGSSRERPNTSAFVVLNEVMRLKDYAVIFPAYPWLEPIRPFAGWSADAPTRSLEWYDAYNAVKHNRGEEFPRASLLHAFEAVSACLVLLSAQFGYLGTSEALNEMLRIVDEPTWPLQECYCGAIGTGSWVPAYHPLLSAIV